LPRIAAELFVRLDKRNLMFEVSGCDRVRSPIYSDDIEFSFLNGNLVVRRSRQPISMVQTDAAHPQNGAVNTN
jgi:hypothetical protein